VKSTKAAPIKGSKPLRTVIRIDTQEKQYTFFRKFQVIEEVVSKSRAISTLFVDLQVAEIRHQTIQHIEIRFRNIGRLAECRQLLDFKFGLPI
jgi:hypothetical protein